MSLIPSLRPRNMPTRDLGALSSPGARAGEEATGPDDGKCVWCPPGEFPMGRGSDERSVRITRGFWIGKFPVTNAQYARFLAAHAEATDAQGHQLIELSGSCRIRAVANEFRVFDGANDHPVIRVTWHGARTYCDHYGLALPPEAQWEYAARGSEWGSDWHVRMRDTTPEQSSVVGHTRVVGSLPSTDSWCGASDMLGSVWQWCADWCGDAKGGVWRRCADWWHNLLASYRDDPTGPRRGHSHVLRGGPDDQQDDWPYPHSGWCAAPDDVHDPDVYWSRLRDRWPRGNMPEPRIRHWACGFGFRASATP